MKRISTILIIILTLSMISLTAQGHNMAAKIKSGQRIVNGPQEAKATSSEYLQGAITIKLKEGLSDFGKQTGVVRFGLQSLDANVAKYQVNQLDKRFRYNPARLRKNLPDLSRIYKISFPDNFPIEEVVQSFSSDPNVEYAEPIPIYHTADIPNDSLYSQMQHLPQIFAPQAWDVHKGENGSEEVVIAIVDTGVDWDHEDLLDNVWQNMAEDADGDGTTIEFNGMQWVLDPGDLNGVDDDGNGFVDDLIGWNFINENGDPHPIPGNPVGFHGTHCAGIADGVTNNGKGIASISWNLSLMGICVAESNALVYGYDGIIYAAENGADVISNSWANVVSSQANQEAVTYAAGLGSIILAAAGNDDYSKFMYPADYENVISVASVSVDDKKASYSNYNIAVDISAPGGGSEGGILSTYPDNTYFLGSGTSMACPLAAGCFGLLKSYHPEWSKDQIVTQLIGTADNIDILNPDYVNMLGSGRVNAYRMLTEENVMPFLKLDLVKVDPADENGNGINEPGEIVTLNFIIHNYAPTYGSENVQVSIITNDPDLTIIDGTGSVNVPPDDSFSIQDQLVVQVGENATCHFADLLLHFESDLQIVAGKDINFKLLVNPSGIFVFEGEPGGQDYSGTMITSFLDRMDFPYTYSNVIASLRGFETVFLSFANSGQGLDKGTTFTEDYSLMVEDYLENEGNLYLEIGGMFFQLNIFGYSNIEQIKQLLGVNFYTLDFSENPVDTLLGVMGSPMQGMIFPGSDQCYNWHIDKLIQQAGAPIAFSETGFGNVAIMNDKWSSQGYRSFYMGYTLADLHDKNIQSSRYNVLIKIMEFFGYSLSDGYLLANFVSDKRIGGMPLEVQFTDISISDPVYPVMSWLWDFENDGTIDSEDKNPVWTFESPGAHAVRLITSNGFKSDTIVVQDAITINSGYLVYEGVSDGVDYSGTFIRDYLEQKSMPVTYRNKLPESLEGFSAVFLSFGNWGSGNTVLDDRMANIITYYLLDSGYVYLEGGDALGYDQADNGTLLFFFGLESGSDGTNNPIDSLGGQPNALTNGMVYTGNSQFSNSYIDIYELALGGTTAFVESNYGTVAVQKGVFNNYRTFCFSYALADLNDAEMPNTKAELLERILNFFDIYTSVPEADEFNGIDCKIYPNPAYSNLTMEYCLPEDGQVILEIFNSTGQKTMEPINGRQFKGEQNVKLNADGLPSGLYYYSLRSGKLAQVGKIVIIK